MAGADPRVDPCARSPPSRANAPRELGREPLGRTARYPRRALLNGLDAWLALSNQQVTDQ